MLLDKIPEKDSRCIKYNVRRLTGELELRYYNDMKIEWDPKKARLNLQKHKVSFEEAATAMSDPMAATGADPDHSLTEDRYITFGVSKRGRLLVVAHTEEEERIRIISARLASKGERKIYEKG
jgi:uncharacterized protein